MRGSMTGGAKNTANSAYFASLIFGDPSGERAISRHENTLCRIHLSAMLRSTVGASRFSHS